VPEERSSGSPSTLSRSYLFGFLLPALDHLRASSLRREVLHGYRTPEIIVVMHASRPGGLARDRCKYSLDRWRPDHVLALLCGF